MLPPRIIPFTTNRWGSLQAVTDAPHCLFAKELIDAYPDAKVVLTMRDPDSWWRSTRATIASGHMIWQRLHAWVDKDAATRWELGRLMALALYGTVNWQNEEKLCKAAFAAHYEYVRSLVPRDRLLEFDVKEGWGPLCNFLGKEVPDQSFPRLFDTAAFQKFAGNPRFAIVRAVLSKVVPVLLVAFALIIYWPVY
ncbi:hypothetical protein C8R46DRAFT_1361717 [Mycena filopes]|nr:hypothetical protein C8R46DRAFT_1361717 [Mycena filopes]